MNNFPELNRLSEVLSELTNTPSSRNYSMAVTTSKEQLLLMQWGRPLLRFRVDDLNEKDAYALGLGLIEKFVLKLANKGHFVLLYDDPAIAREIEFHYVNSRLDKRERCVYLISHDDVETIETIRIQMDSFGIDTHRFLASGQLVIAKIPDTGKELRDFKSNRKDIINSFLKDSHNTVVRIIAHARYQLNSTREIEEHAELEQEIYSDLEGSSASLLCNHYIGRYDSVKYNHWINTVLRSHSVCLVACSEKILPFVFQSEKELLVSYPSSTFSVGPGNEIEIRIAADSDIENHSAEELERDISEIRNDIHFLVAQTKADLDNYDPNDLVRAVAKVSFFKKKEQLLSESLQKKTRNAC